MVTLEKLLKQNEFKNFELVTSKKIDKKLVNGVNMIESVELFPFVRRNEIIFVTGINFDQEKIEDNLLEVIEVSEKNKIAALVLNIGPYIKDVPSKVINRANELDVSVVTMPWRVRIADSMKAIILAIIRSEKDEKKESSIFNKIISDGFTADELVDGALLGFKEPQEYGILMFECNQKNKQQVFEKILVLLKRRYRFFIDKKVAENLVVIINRADVRPGVGPFSETGQYLYHTLHENKFFIGMGNFYEHIHQLHMSYLQAIQVIGVVKKQRSNLIFKYKNLGVYKLLLELRNTTYISKFHKEMLGPLINYDKQNAQGYVDFLKVYLEEDGKTVNVSKRLFIHRNTVMYKIKKVEQILDMDISTTLDKTSLSLAFLIEDLPEK
jgi:hypothetical protein